MKGLAPLGAPAAELVLRGLFLAPDDARLRALASAARADGAFEGVAEAAEAHGVLCLLKRNLEACDARIPAPLAEVLAGRDEALRGDARRDGATVACFLTAARELGLEVVLLKGAALAVDRYPDPALRRQGDVDLLVRRAEVDRALAAGERAGLVPGDGALASWWYLLAHFHLKLAPPTALLREVELHWALHPPARLFTVDLERLWSRRRPVAACGLPAADLDPLDRLLHLATHLTGHWHGTPGPPGRERLLEVLRAGPHPVRLKWVLDLQVEAEAIARQVEPRSLVERAREWNAEVELGFGLGLARHGPSLGETAEAWVRAVEGELGVAAASGRGVSRAPAGQALPGVDFRAATLRALPRWSFPPASFLRRRHRRPRGSLFLLRCVHATGVLARVALGTLALPIAWIGGRLARASRRRVRERARTPEGVLAAAAAWLAGRGDRTSV